MSAHADRIVLELQADGRRLYMSVSPGDCAYAAVHPVRRKGNPYVARPYATGLAQLSDGRGTARTQFSIRWDDDGPTLWLGSASFVITASEAAQIERAFAAHGLQVLRPSPAAA